MLSRTLFTAVLAIASVAHATNVVLPYAGRLIDADDTPVSAVHELKFSLVPAETGGTAVWTETHSVSISLGYYAVDLGSVTPISDALLEQDLWLQVNVQSTDLMPRHKLSMLPHAARAANALSLGGHPAADYVRQGAESVTVEHLRVTDLAVNLASGTAPTAAVHVNGRVLADGYDELSDGTLKRDVVPLEDVRGRLQKVRGVRYGWNERAQQKYGRSASATEIGVVAQEVEAAFPELVTKLSNGDRAVDYGRLSAVLLEAVKAQDAELEALRGEVRALSKAVGQGKKP